MSNDIKVGSESIVDNTGKWIKDNPHVYQDDIYIIATEVFENIAIHNFVGVQPMPYRFKLKEFKEDSSESYFVLSRYT